MSSTQLRLGQIKNAEVKIKDDAESETTATTWQTKLTLPVESRGQSWLLLSNAECLSTTNLENIEVQIDIDGTIIAASAAVPFKVPDKYFSYSPLDFITLAAGSHTIKLQFKSSTGNLVKIRRARFFLFDLS